MVFLIQLILEKYLKYNKKSKYTLIVSKINMFKDKEELSNILDFQYKHINPTPQIYWPKVFKRFGCKVLIKHENHTPIGSFKIRSSLTLIKNQLTKNINFCCASNGNYGQGIAFAANALIKKAKIFCPLKTSKSKINSISAFGVDVILKGKDFNETYEIAYNFSKKNDIILLPSYSEDLAKGCATYSFEFFNKCNDLHKVYVPIGLGSGICGTIFTRNLYNLNIEIIGVVPKEANSYFLSYKNKSLTSINQVNTFAEGTAVRKPDKKALEIISRNVSDIIQIKEDEIKEAVRNIYDDTGNIAEGSGALAYAAAYKQREINKNKNIGIILTGGNIDRKFYSKILSE